MKRSYIVIAGLFVTASACSQPPTPTPAPDVTGCPPGQRWLVHGSPAGTSAEGAPVVAYLGEIDVTVVCMTKPEVSAAETEGVEIERDTIMTIPEGDQKPGRADVNISTDVNPALDPLEPQQWGLSKIRSRDADVFGRGGNVMVAVIDTGVDCSHRDLAARCTHLVDLVPEDPRLHPHGTHVAGIAAATVDDGYGVRGVVPEAVIGDARVLDGGGSGFMSAVAQGIIHAVNYSAETSTRMVINMSLGSPEQSDAIDSAVGYALSKNVVVVAAAGNSNTSQLFYPAASPGAIAVGATTNIDQKASFSNFGVWVPISAPGVSILSTVPCPACWATYDGTSMASPFVAGAAARLLAQGVTSDSVLTRLRAAADPGPANMGGKRLNDWRAGDQLGTVPPPETRVPIPTDAPSTAYPAPATETPKPPPVPATLVPSPVRPTATRPPATATRTATPCVLDGWVRVRGQTVLRKVYGPCGQ